jgi:hypothetical protein
MLPKAKWALLQVAQAARSFTSGAASVVSSSRCRVALDDIRLTHNARAIERNAGAF